MASVFNLMHAVDSIWRKPFVRNVAVVASGTAGAQAISMAFAPLITRIYGPDAYGLLGVFMATVSIVAPVAALAYPMAIVLPKRDKGARAIMQLAFIISASVAALALVAFGLAGEQAFALVGAAEIGAFALLIPLVLLLSAYHEIGQQWLIRKHAFRASARAAVTRSFLVGSAKTAAGVFYPFGSVLIGLYVAGIALHGVLLSLAAQRLPDRFVDARRWVGWSAISSAARAHRDFPIYRAPQSLINAASHAVPLLLLGAFFGPAAAGFYALGRTVLGIPAGLVAQAVSMVFYPRITEAAHRGESGQRLILAATGGLILVGIVPFGVIFFSGPLLFSWIFGHEWAVAGEYARWLSLMYFMHFINGPSVAALPVLGLQRGLLGYELLSTGAKVIALYIGFAMYEDSQFAVALFAVAGAIAYMCLIVWTINCAGRESTEAMDDSRKAS
jgi:O-antigen/teichoic acid export membrane protein